MICVTAREYLEQGNLSLIIHDNKGFSGQMIKSCNYYYLLEPGNKVATACVGFYNMAAFVTRGSLIHTQYLRR